MDLKRNQITLAQLMADPKAKAVLQRRFGPYLKHPMAKAAGSLTLAQLMEMGAVYLPQKTIQETVLSLIHIWGIKLRANQPLPRLFT